MLQKAFDMRGNGTPPPRGVPSAWKWMHSEVAGLWALEGWVHS